MYIHIYIEYKKCSSYPIKIDELREVFFRFPGEASEAKVEDRAGRRGEVGRMAMAHNPQGF